MVVRVPSDIVDRINSVDGLMVLYNGCETMKCVRRDEKSIQ